MGSAHDLAGDAFPGAFPEEASGGAHQDEISLHLSGRLTDGRSPVRSLNKDAGGFNTTRTKRRHHGFDEFAAPFLQVAIDQGRLVVASFAEFIEGMPAFRLESIEERARDLNDRNNGNNPALGKDRLDQVGNRGGRQYAGSSDQDVHANRLYVLRAC